MSHRWIALLVGLAGCSASPAPSPEAPPPAATPSAPAPVATEAPATSATAAPPEPASPTPAKAKLGYKDFLEIAGLSAKTPTLAAAQKAWGPGKRAGDKVRYDKGPTVETFDSGVMIDISTFAGPWVEEHVNPDKPSPLSVFGKSCAEAAAMLDFTDKVGGYMTCKHYEPTLYLDVTMMCIQDEVTTLVVVWVPFDPKDAVNPLPGDHCSY